MTGWGIKTRQVFPLFVGFELKRVHPFSVIPELLYQRFTTISCLHLNERGGAIPGDIRQLRVELLLTGAPTPAKTGGLFGRATI